MYHPSRGGVRGGRDQFSWDDVKIDKHRENYLGHSIKAPVGRWQKGKDLTWYAGDKNSKSSDTDAMKEEIQRIKEQEEQAMREALGLAPKRGSKFQGNKLDKHEFSELVKRSSTVEDLGADHAEAAMVHGLGFSRGSRNWEDSSSLQPSMKTELLGKKEMIQSNPSPKHAVEVLEKESLGKRRRHEEKRHERHEKRERREEREEKHRFRDSDDKRRHKKGKEKRRHDSD